MTAASRGLVVGHVVAGEGGTVAADAVFASRDDRVVVEAPLEVQIFDGTRFRSLAVLMRSPDDEDDDDRELVAGFLVTEGIVANVADVDDIRACTVAPSPEAEGNVWQVRLRAGVVVDWARLQRNTYVSSSCGVCGKASIDNAMVTAGVVDSDVVVDAAVVLALPAALRRHQTTFEETGGLHGALLCSKDGGVVVAREDVGRHNAVDKVIGHALLHRRRGDLLFVSGRVSFELVQKAVAARIAVIAGVSAPTSLAVDLGARAGVCVVGFVRGASFNIYSRVDRVIAPVR